MEKKKKRIEQENIQWRKIYFENILFLYMIT